MAERARRAGVVTRPLEAPESLRVLREATLGNLNWQGARFEIGDVIERPEFEHYTRLDLERGDFGVVAMSVQTEPCTQWLGVAWALQLPAEDPGWGFVAPGIPEVSVYVQPEWRNRRVGRMLLRDLHAEARRRGLRAVSLSVEDGNYARLLYESLGYAAVPAAAPGTMLLHLPPGPDLRGS